MKSHEPASTDSTDVGFGVQGLGLELGAWVQDFLFYSPLHFCACAGGPEEATPALSPETCRV